METLEILPDLPIEEHPFPPFFAAKCQSAAHWHFPASPRKMGHALLLSQFPK